MRLKRRNVVRCSNSRREKRDVVRRTGPGKYPWNKEAGTLRWTIGEVEEHNRMCARLGWSYTDSMNDVKEFYYRLAPIYEEWCEMGEEYPSDEGFADFAMKVLDRMHQKLDELEKLWMH